MNKGLYKEDRILMLFFFFSLRFEFFVKDESSEKKVMNIVCYYCNQFGYKVFSCLLNFYKENYKVGFKILQYNGLFEVFQFLN